MSSAIHTSAPAAVPVASAATPLAIALENQAGVSLISRSGMRTLKAFDEPSQEIDSLLHSAGLIDLGWLGRVQITGQDRLRWLNGMVTNAVQALPEGEGNYSFLLNAQGKIQGDCMIYRRAGDLWLDTTRDQLPVLQHHLERYIIMDDVELEDVSGNWTTLSLAGPRAPQILEALGIALPGSAASNGNARMSEARIAGIEILVIQGHSVLVPHFELWVAPAAVLPVWQALKDAGATPAGLLAAEALRVLEGIPLYGIDLSERDLPQETSQARALSFSKGCYIGQEIVERIRSRGKVHRRLRQFLLRGSVPATPFDLRTSERVVGRITSTASLPKSGITGGQGITGNFALGFLRHEGAAGNEAEPKGGSPQQDGIPYDGGFAIPLEAPPPLNA